MRLVHLRRYLRWDYASSSDTAAGEQQDTNRFTYRGRWARGVHNVAKDCRGLTLARPPALRIFGPGTQTRGLGLRSPLS